MASSSPSLNLDVNFLAALLSSLNENNTQDARREGLPDKSTGLLAREAPILDSLAHLSICNREKQVVAIAAEMHSAGVHLYVAENGAVDKRVVPILQDLISTLKSVRDLARASPNIDLQASPPTLFDDIYTVDPNSPPADELTNLEVRLVKHNWSKLKRRLHKRYDAFIEFIDEVRSTSPDALRVPVAKEDRWRWAALQSGTNRTVLDLVHSFVVPMEDRFKTDPLVESGAQLIAGYTTKLYTELITFLGDWTKNSDPHPFFMACDSYLKCRGKDQQLPMKRWLHKLISVHIHFLNVVNLVGSNKLAHFLDNVTIFTVPPCTSDVEIKVDYERLQAVARAAGWKPRPDSPTSSSEEEDPADSILPNDPLRVFFGELDQRLPRSTNAEQTAAPVPTSSPPDIVIRTYKDVKVHCECSLLAYLHQGSIIPIPYIGVSKLSCYLCNAYISCHSQSTRFPVTTRGCHSQVAAPWVCPPTSSADVKERLTKVVLEKLFRHLSEVDNELQEARSRARNASQSTVGSSSGTGIRSRELMLSRGDQLIARAKANQSIELAERKAEAEAKAAGKAQTQAKAKQKSTSKAEAEANRDAAQADGRADEDSVEDGHLFLLDV